MKNGRDKTGDHLFDIMRGDMRDKRASMTRGGAGIFGNRSRLEKTALELPGASSAMGKAVNADAARKIVDPVKQRLSMARNHNKLMNLGVPGSQGRSAGIAQASIGRADGTVSFRRALPAQARPPAPVGAPAAPVVAPAAPAVAPSALALRQQQDQAMAKNIQKAQKAQRIDKAQPNLQILNGDFEGAQNKATALQAQANKAQQGADKLTAQAQGPIPGAAPAAPGAAPAAPGAAPAAPGESFWNTPLSAQNRQRALMGAGALGVAATGYGAARLMAGNNQQGQY